MEIDINPLIIGVPLFILVVMGLIIPLLWRVVVPTNEIHAVQYKSQNVSYGRGEDGGNVYYKWPSWLPMIGVQTMELDVSIFELEIKNYEAFDKDKLPFRLDITAFFQISDAKIAAQRVSNTDELQQQLDSIVKGASRAILAGFTIQEIMEGRSAFGDRFTLEVKEQLAAWGVSTVKNIELMDIRDSESSRVIRDIMEKKKSHIEMESRTEVAANRKMADLAEISATQEVMVRRQESDQAVGLRTVESERAVKLADEESKQVVFEKSRVTKEKEMAVVQVQQVKQQEILKETAVIEAQQQKEVAILAADAALEAQKKAAEGTQIEGEAKAAAAKAMELAPIQAQIELATKIGENQAYQNYLIGLEQVKANKEVGIEQAKALQLSEIKVIANASDASSGIKSIGDLVSSNGGLQIGAMLEGFANTETGKKVLNKLGGSNEGSGNQS